MQKPELSVVVPVLNEVATINAFIDAVGPEIRKAVTSWELIFVDDGSTDGTANLIRKLNDSDPRIKLIELSRNFGKEAALTAGLEAASGQAVVPMDVDLQDPPELLGEFVRLWRSGYEIVCAQRVRRDADTRSKRASAQAFYNVFNRISDNSIDPQAGDYRLMCRAAVDATLLLRERNRFMKGLFAWVGFRTASVPFERPERVAGETKFSFWKLWNFAIDGITSFSTTPLRVWSYVGLLVALMASMYLIFLFIRTLVYGSDVPGYASVMVAMLFLGAIQLISLGVMGEYLGRLYIEVKQRPLFIVRSSAGFEGRAPELASGPQTSSVASGADQV